MKNKIRLLLKVLFGIGIVVYPFLIFWALQQGVSLRLISLVLVGVLLGNCLNNHQVVALGAGGLLMSLLFIFENALFLKLYPVAMNFLVCATFVLSLRQTPVIETFARKMGKVLDENGQAYTRKATLVWSIFLCINTLFSFVTVFLPMTCWVWYNGFISYVLIGIMMLGEWCVRRRRAV